MANFRCAGVLHTTRLERFVLVELLGSFGLALAAFTLLILIGGAYGPIRDGLRLDVLLEVVPLMIPFALPWTIPTSFVAACIMVYSRMAGDNELMAIRAAGVHVWRVLSPAAALALWLGVACAFLNNVWVPRASFYQYSLVKADSASKQAAALQWCGPVVRIASYTIFIRNSDGKDGFEDVIIVAPEKPIEAEPGGRPRYQRTYVKAPRARVEYSNERSEVIFHLESDPAAAPPGHPDAGKAVMYKAIFGTTALDFEKALFGSCRFPIRIRSLADVNFQPRKSRFMTTETLLLRLWRRRADIAARRLGPPDAGTPPDKLEFEQELWNDKVHEMNSWATQAQQNAAMSLAPMLLGAIAIPLGVMTARGRKLIAFGLALALVLGVYYPLLVASSALGESGTMPPAAAVWGGTLVMAAAGIALIRNMLRR